jgi:predicted ABC-type ATPase
MTKEEFLQQVKFDKPTVFILRGIPGAGKSTIEQMIYSRTTGPYNDCSADSYFIQAGTYNFDRSMIGLAHQSCLRRFISCVQGYWPPLYNGVWNIIKYSCIFLDNTNTTISEFSHYVKIADAYGYKTVIVTLNISVETSLKRNVHQVPEKTIRGMYQRLNDTDNVLKLNRFCREHNIEHFNIDTEV